MKKNIDNSPPPHSQNILKIMFYNPLGKSGCRARLVGASLLHFFYQYNIKPLRLTKQITNITPSYTIPAIKAAIKSDKLERQLIPIASKYRY